MWRRNSIHCPSIFPNFSPSHLMQQTVSLLLGIALFLFIPHLLQAQSEIPPTGKPTPPAPDLARQLAAIEPMLPSLYLGTTLLSELPELTGIYGPRHYLLVVQNSDELRATGGFISALGTITLDKGRLANLEFVDSYHLYRTDQSYPPAPAPMSQFMDIPYILFRDANWSPDFPTTAALLRVIYRQETGVDIDGIVTVDLHALEMIVGALAPLQMPNAPEELTGANVVTFVKDMWAQPQEGNTITEVGLGKWWGQRKSFIPTLAGTVMEKLRSGGVDYIAVAMAAERALNERAIQIWLADEHAAAQLAVLGWDGSLQVAPDADYLSLIDTNMGYNKVNAVIQRSLAYTVTWPTDTWPTERTERAEATVTIDYRHPITVPDHLCDLTPRYGENYQDLVERCFFNYVRLYVPNGSNLISVEGLQDDSIQTNRGEHGTQVFAGYFVLQPGEATRIVFRYQLPATVRPESYQLLIQRQSGSGPLSIHLSVGGSQTRTTLRGNTWLWTPLQQGPN